MYRFLEGNINEISKGELTNLNLFLLTYSNKIIRDTLQIHRGTKGYFNANL